MAEALGTPARPQAAVTRNDELNTTTDIELDELSGTRIVEPTLLTGNKLSFAAITRGWDYFIDPLLVCQDERGQLVHDPRDFLALERTHLAYIRTGNALALFGVTMAQLFILHDAGSVYGRTLAACAYGLAIVIVVSSAVRVVLLQDKIIARQMVTAARLVSLIVVLLTALLLAIFVVNLLI